ATRRILSVSFVALIAVVVSFIPTAILNIHYLHDWSGLSIEHEGMNMKNPVAGILGNAVLLITNNFVPTFFPMAHWWNAHALSLFPSALVRLMNANFEHGYEMLGEMPTEDWAGFGFGVSMLVLISVIAGWLKPRHTQHAARNTFSFFLLLAPWVSLLAYCMKTGAADRAVLSFTAAIIAGRRGAIANCSPTMVEGAGGNFVVARAGGVDRDT